MNSAQTVMPTALELATMILETFLVHDMKAREPRKQFRRDGKTPFGVHPVTLALLVLNEETLPEEFRVRGAKALLAHDMLEDTSSKLPGWAKSDPEVEKLVHELTFHGSEDKFQMMWYRNEDALVLILFDCTMGMTCRGGERTERIAVYKAEMPKLIAFVEKRYPKLEIIKMAKAFLAALP